MTAAQPLKGLGRRSPGGTPRTRARKGEGALLREQILDATERLLAEKGGAGAVSIRDIAERVGVTPPAIYLHFADKDQLVYATCRRGFEHFAAELEPIITEGGTPIERLRRLGRAYIEFGLGHPQLYSVLFSANPPDTIPAEWLTDDPGHRVLFGLVALVAEGIAAGEVRPELDPAATAATLWAASHGTVHVLQLRRKAPQLAPIPEEEVVIDTTVDLLSAGFATPKGKRRLAGRPAVKGAAN